MLLDHYFASSAREQPSRSDSLTGMRLQECKALPGRAECLPLLLLGHCASKTCCLPCVCAQDVELQSNCLLTCFGLKAVNVQTAGQGGTVAPEVSAAFLKSPEKVREAIQLAVKLYRQQGTQAGTSRGPFAASQAPLPAWGEVSAAGAKVGSSMVQRLQGLEALVTRGVLTRAEADGLKVGGENRRPK